MDTIKLVKKAQKGSTSSFERLIQTYKLTMYRVARSILKNEEDCADALQEAILKAFQQIKQLQKPVYFKTWLLRIVMNECYNIHRRNKNLVSIEEWHEPKGTEDTHPFESESILDVLKEKDRTLLKLFHLDDISIKELAVLYDCSENTIKSRLRRAREQVRSRIILKKEEGIWRDGNSK
ncbi:RNA polymerase sigma factor [Evansella clarkii]|uniref:RNA polymerase sigma factor n=1 Tax=Evansella clarkii TaxID=79879 RepID=UPI0009967D8B|nr:sigma-70 family RNA polymerase sigma factor [Evansella clarkii]